MRIEIREIEQRLNHEPCCDHHNHHFGHCTDCMDTGCAHAPYVEGEARVDLRALLRIVQAWRVRAALIGLGAFASGWTAQFVLWPWIGGAS